jgi:hypothetical protein
MLKLFKKIFGKPEKKSISHTENVKQNKIIFSIDQWDRMTIDISFQNEDMPCAETFGKLLYSINHGIYEDKILECLVSLSKSSPSLVPCIHKALNTWGIMIINKDNDPQSTTIKSPFIKPTSVFNK